MDRSANCSISVVHVHCNVKIDNERYIILGGSPMRVPGGVHGCVQACVKAGLQCDPVTCALLRKCNTQNRTLVSLCVAIQFEQVK